MSRELKEQIKEREKLYINSVKHPTEAHIKIYKKFRNQLVLSNQRRAARNYYHEQFEIRGPNTKSGRALINFLTGQGDKNSQKNHEFMINNKMISDNVTIADSFNEYFVNVGKSLAQKITSTDDPLSYIDYNNHCISELVVTEDCVKTVISQLNNSAPGHDGLPPSIIKQLTNEYVIPLTHLINLSIVQGDFPNELKLAKVLPICNSEEEQFTQNYRPISVLPYFSKIYVRVIYNHLMQYINSNDILYDKQFGFRKGHSTSHAIITLVEKVSKALDSDKIVVGVYLDISVRHLIVYGIQHYLINFTSYVHIRGNLFCLIKSYFISRRQYVHYNGCNSSSKSIEYGVPQGSILWPLFFIIFMNDFSRASQLFFFLIDKEYTQLIVSLNKELKKVSHWLNANGLTINVKKTHFMVFHRARIKAKDLNARKYHWLCDSKEIFRCNN